MSTSAASPLDIARLRRDTPGCARVIHLNNAGAALMPRPVHEAVAGHLERELLTGGYEAAADAAGAVADTYAAIAAMLGCAAEEVAVVENATRAWDMAFYGIPFRPGDRVLTTAVEYAANFVALLQMRRRVGIEIVVVPDDPATGTVDLAALETELSRGARLVCLTHVPTGSGVVAPAAEVGCLAKAHGALYLLDACQSAGQMPLDVEALGCDFLSATGRKYLRGPRGTGFLYCRASLLPEIEPPVLDHHAAPWTGAETYEPHPTARRFEAWEGFVAGKIGLGVAVRYAVDAGLAAMAERITTLAADLRAGLAAVPGVTVHDAGARLCGICTFTITGHEAPAVQAALRARGINTSVSDLASSRLDFTRRGLSRVNRASVHAYNTEDEIARAVDAVARLAAGR